MTDTTQELHQILTELRARFPEFDYLQPGGVLSIQVDPTLVERIRVELTGERRLHLQSLELVKGGVQTTAATGLLTASQGLDVEDDDALGRLVDTGLVNDPWFELTLDPPVEVTELRLHNVDTKGWDAGRLHDVRVLVASPDGDLATVFDAADRAEVLHEAAVAMAAEAGVEFDAHSGVLLRMLTDTIVGRYADARSSQKDTKGMSDERRRGFRDVVNRELLPSRSLEWTAHGAQRSFRYYPDDELVEYVRATVELTEALSTLTPNVCFGFGAALAAVRDGKPIPHDDDLDIIIGFEPHEAATLDEALVLIEEHLTPLGFVVDGGTFTFRKARRPDAMPIDVFVGLFEGDKIAWYPGKRKSLDRSTMFPVSQGELLGIACPLPHDPETYLETLYGPDWRIPDAAFKHTFAKKRYADQTAGGALGAPAPAPRRRLSRLLRRD